MEVLGSAFTDILGSWSDRHESGKFGDVLGKL